MINKEDVELKRPGEKWRTNNVDVAGIDMCFYKRMYNTQFNKEIATSS
jgi:hypothetical protein